jgi:sugar phosphate isomerase/epimerase
MKATAGFCGTALIPMKTTLASLFGAALLAGSLTLAADPIPDDVKIGGFAIGCQAYSFNRFSVMEAIEKTDQAGGRIIEFYPGQRLSKEEPNLKWDHNASDELIARVKEKLAKHRVRAVNYGVVGIPKDEAEARKVFAFAKKLGLYAVTTESIDALDTIEKLAKEYDIRVGIHEHAKRPNDPSYKIWDPAYVLSLVKDRDSRLGACADTGHWTTSGVKALEAIKLLKGRVVSLHLKDRPVFGEAAADTHYGTGVVNVGAILDELKKQKFAGNISIEYENNWDHSVPDIAQCIGFVRGYGAAKH